MRRDAIGRLATASGYRYFSCNFALRLVIARAVDNISELRIAFVSVSRISRRILEALRLTGAVICGFDSCTCNYAILEEDPDARTCLLVVDGYYKNHCAPRHLFPPIFPSYSYRRRATTNLHSLKDNQRTEEEFAHAGKSIRIRRHDRRGLPGAATPRGARSDHHYGYVPTPVPNPGTKQEASPVYANDA
jgi:hypothetical protein